MINTVGRRKTSVSRIYMTPGKGIIIVNGKTFEDYFKNIDSQNSIKEPLELTGLSGKYDIKVNVSGGGFTGQSQAVRLGIARAIVNIDEAQKPILREHGLLTRDSRMVERKKPGKKKARKSFQFSKR